MDAENYVIQYPLDAVHVDKFADLLGKAGSMATKFTGMTGAG